MKALITGDFGREFLAETAERSELKCIRKGKKQDVTCGDMVEIVITSPGNARIESVEPRRNVLFRQDATPEEFAAYIQHEAQKWSGVIKTIGLKPQ